MAAGEEAACTSPREAECFEDGALETVSAGKNAGEDTREDFKPAGEGTLGWLRGPVANHRVDREMRPTAKSAEGRSALMRWAEKQNENALTKKAGGNRTRQPRWNVTDHPKG